MNRKKKFVVIGSNCFTGSHIVDALLESPDNYVVGVSRSPEYNDMFLPYKRHKTDNFQFIQINIIRQFDKLIQFLDEVKPQIIINVAALSEVVLSNKSPVEYFETNTLAVVKLCNQLRTREYLRQYVHISSAEIFGSCKNPLSEKALFNPSTPYAVSKVSADMYLNTIYKNFNFPVTIIRSTNVYGKHQQLFKIIPRTVIYIKMGKQIELHGGGKAKKSFIHIKDVVRGLILAIKGYKLGTYHFTVQSDLSVADIIRMICCKMGVKFESVTKFVEERLGQDTVYLLDTNKARKELNWQPVVSIDEGLAEVVDWIEEKWNEVKKQPLVYIHKK